MRGAFLGLCGFLAGMLCARVSGTPNARDNSAEVQRLAVKLAQTEDILHGINVERSKGCEAIRRLKSARVDSDAVAAASFDIGIPASLLIAVREHENGPRGFELGDKGKTWFFVKNTPPSQLQYFEAARSMNIIIWKWIFSDSQRKRKAFEALSHYTQADHQKDWFLEVLKLEKRAEK